MSLPTKQEFLNNLLRMKRDCIAFMEDAERRGDSCEAREFREHLERVESMIDQSGGDPDASELNRAPGAGSRMVTA